MTKINYEILPEDYSEVIYGDSVTDDTIILLKCKESGKIFPVEINEVTNFTNSGWFAFPGFKVFDHYLRISKEYLLVDYDIYTHIGWQSIKKVIKHKTKKQIYRITTNVGTISVTEDHSLITAAGDTISPKDIAPYHTVLLHDEEIYNNFIHLKETTLNEVTKDTSDLIFRTRDSKKVFGYIYTLKQQKIDCIVNCNNGVWEIVPNDLLCFSEKPGTVLKIEIEVDYSGYVYDVETVAGTFHAGLGSLIVKNTDSCMLKLKTTSSDLFVDLSEKLKNLDTLSEDQISELNSLKTKVLEESFTKGKKLSKEITDKLFKHPIELEFEKVYHPYILLTKKRYIGNYYGESPYKIDKLEKKGIVLSRRDNANIVKKIYGEILDPLLIHGTRGIKKSIDILRGYLQNLIDNKVELQDLVITKTLKKGYGKVCKCGGGDIKCPKNCTDGIIFNKTTDYSQINSPHVTLCIKKRKRDPGSAPVMNDRISYVFVNIPDKPDAKLYEKAEELENVIAGNLKLDLLYYIENQIRNPVTEILRLVSDETEKIFDDFTKQLKIQRAKDIKAIKIKRSIAPGQSLILRWVIKK